MEKENKAGKRLKKKDEADSLKEHQEIIQKVYMRAFKCTKTSKTPDNSNKAEELAEWLSDDLKEFAEEKVVYLESNYLY